MSKVFKESNKYESTLMQTILDLGCRKTDQKIYTRDLTSLTDLKIVGDRIHTALSCDKL